MLSEIPIATDSDRDNTLFLAPPLPFLSAPSPDISLFIYLSIRSQLSIGIPLVGVWVRNSILCNGRIALVGIRVRNSILRCIPFV